MHEQRGMVHKIHNTKLCSWLWQSSHLGFWALLSWAVSVLLMYDDGQPPGNGPKLWWKQIPLWTNSGWATSTTTSECCYLILMKWDWSHGGSSHYKSNLSPWYCMSDQWYLTAARLQLLEKLPNKTSSNLQDFASQAQISASGHINRYDALGFCS